MKKKEILVLVCFNILLLSLVQCNYSGNMFSATSTQNKEIQDLNQISSQYSSGKWTTTEVISLESSDDGVYPNMVADSKGNLHVVWYDWTNYLGAGTDLDIFYNHWNSSTKTWSSTEVVSTESTLGSYAPIIAVDSSDNVHVVWSDYTNYAGSGTDEDIFHKYKDSITETWSTLEVVSTESSDHSGSLDIVINSADNIYVTWQDYTNYAGCGTDQDIFCKFWNSKTQTWSTTFVISTQSSGDSYHPSIDIDYTGNLYIVWFDITDYAGAGTDRDIFYKYWDNSTSTWSITEVLSTVSSTHSFYPDIAVDSAANVHVIWFDEADYYYFGTDRDVFYRRCSKTSRVWSATEVISAESTESSSYVTLTVDSSDNVLVVWGDYTNYKECGSDGDIFFRWLSSISSAWSPLEVISTESTSTSANPHIITDASGTIHVAWYDATNYTNCGTDYDIFYKKFIATPESPVLAFIHPTPTDSSDIFLDWTDVNGATNFYIYRSSSYIWSIQGLTPVATTITSSYTDSLPSEGYFYYVIVATNGLSNSTKSNCEYVHYTIPHVREFAIASSLLLGVIVISFFVFRKRRKK